MQVNKAEVVRVSELSEATAQYRVEVVTSYAPEEYDGELVCVETWQHDKVLDQQQAFRLLDRVRAAGSVNAGFWTCVSDEVVKYA